MKTLTQQIYLLSPPGGLFDTSVVRNLFPDLSPGARNILVHRAVESGEVQQLKRGLYVLSAPFRKTHPHPFAVAPMLYAPSTISLESALAFHGLIPEAVYQTTSTTPKRTRRFSTPLGDFAYHAVPSSNALAGVESIKLDNTFWAFVATPFKAIADLVYLRKEVEWKTDGLAFLTESMRMETDDLFAISLAVADEVIDSIRNRRTREYMQTLKEELRS
jgi:predicted transcriptional regulator of viral defense system